MVPQEHLEEIQVGIPLHPQAVVEEQDITTAIPRPEDQEVVLVGRARCRHIALAEVVVQVVVVEIQVGQPVLILPVRLPD